MIKITSFNNKRLTKVTWQKELSVLEDEIGPDWNNWTSASLMPWCFSATTAEETLKAAHQLKFGLIPMESLTSLEDGSFLMTYKHGTLRVIMEQEAYAPRQKSQEQYEEEQACMWHDWE